MNIEKDSKVPIVSHLENGMVFLILGSVEVSPTNNGDLEEKHFLSSLFDQREAANRYVYQRRCISMNLDDQSEYEIQSRGCDSIALLVHYKDDHPLSVVKK